MTGLRHSTCAPRFDAILKHVLNDSPQLDRAFQALSDPTRRGLLAQLSRGPASVSDLARPLAISLPAVLQHLQALEASGLIASTKSGRVRTCRIEPAALSAAETWIATQRALWSSRLDRLETHLASIQQETAA
jgi:DNA-binding transcriptional ArsR family regulator